jgi:hypothetical protein
VRVGDEEVVLRIRHRRGGHSVAASNLLDREAESLAKGAGKAVCQSHHLARIRTPLQARLLASAL